MCFSRSAEEFSTSKRPQFHHDETQSPRMPKAEKQVLAVEALSWNYPFVGDQDLNSISTAKEVPADISYDLLHSSEI